MWTCLLISGRSKTQCLRFGDSINLMWFKNKGLGNSERFWGGALLCFRNWVTGGTCDEQPGAVCVRVLTSLWQLPWSTSLKICWLLPWALELSLLSASNLCKWLQSWGPGTEDRASRERVKQTVTQLLCPIWFLIKYGAPSCGRSVLFPGDGSIALPKLFKVVLKGQRKAAMWRGRFFGRRQVLRDLEVIIEKKKPSLKPLVQSLAVVRKANRIMDCINRGANPNQKTCSCYCKAWYCPTKSWLVLIKHCTAA